MRYCVGSKFLAFYETVWYDIKMSLKFGGLKIICFGQKTFFKVFRKWDPNFGSFGWMRVNEMKPIAMYCLIRPYFQFKSYPPNILNKYLTKMYRHFSRIRWYSMHSNIRLQSCAAFDSFKQNSKVSNYIKQNVSSNFGQFHPFQW